MLKKGPFLFQAISELDPLLGRMDEHMHKKTPRLRRSASCDLEGELQTRNQARLNRSLAATGVPRPDTAV